MIEIIASVGIANLFGNISLVDLKTYCINKKTTGVTINANGNKNLTSLCGIRQCTTNIGRKINRKIDFLRSRSKYKKDKPIKMPIGKKVYLIIAYGYQRNGLVPNVEAPSSIILKLK